MTVRLEDLAHIVGGTVEGGGDTEVSAVADPHEALPGDIAAVFGSSVPDGCRASAVVVRPGCDSRGLPCIRVDSPRLALVTLLQVLHPVPEPVAGIHETAVVSPQAQLGEGVSIGPLAVVGAATVGNGTRISSQCTVGDGVQIGRGCVLHAGVRVLDGCVLGDRVIIHAGSVIGADGFGYEATATGLVKIPQVGNVVIEDDVEIGALTAVDRGTLPRSSTVIGRGAKLDNLVQIGHNVRIGQHAIVCGQTGVGGSSLIGNGAVLAGKVGVSDHRTVGDGAIIGGMSAIYRDVQPGAQVLGVPARPRMEQHRVQAALTSLPELLKRVKRLERAAGLAGEAGEAGD